MQIALDADGWHPYGGSISLDADHACDLIERPESEKRHHVDSLTAVVQLNL